MTSTTGVLTITAVADIPQSISIALACEIQVSAYILMCQAQIRVVFDIEAITVLVTQMGGKFGTTLHPSAVFNYIHGRSYVDNSFQRGQIYCYLCWLVSLKGGSEHSYGKKKQELFPVKTATRSRICEKLPQEVLSQSCTEDSLAIILYTKYSYEMAVVQSN